MYEIFEKLLKEHGITAYRFCKDTGVSSSTISTWKKKNSRIGMETAGIIADYFDITIDYLMTGQDKDNTELTAKDERDIAKDMENIIRKLRNQEEGPASYDGNPIPEEDIDLLAGQIELMIRRLKPINKQKYNPHKSKR